MAIVKITSPGVSIALELQLEDDEALSNFLIVDGRSSARDYLPKLLNLSNLEGRREWNAAQIMKDLEIKIPTLYERWARTNAENKIDAAMKTLEEMKFSFEKPKPDSSRNASTSSKPRQ